MRILASLALAACAGPSLLPAQSLTVSTTSRTVAQFDTLGGIMALPKMVGGRTALVSPVTWTATPASLATVVTTDTIRHLIALAANAQGTVKLVATWRTFPGTVHVVAGQPVLDVVTLHDSLIIAIRPPRVVSVHTFTSADSVGIGDTFCAYATAYDRRGNVLTGLPVTFASSDTTVIAHTGPGACPDTSVDSAKVVPLSSIRTVRRIPPVRIARRP